MTKPVIRHIESALASGAARLRWRLRRLDGGQALQLGADVGHAARDDHAPDL